MSTLSTADGTTRPSRASLLAAAVLLAVTFVAAGGFGIAWAVDATSGSGALANQRDEALSAGRVEIANFNTLDHHRVDEGLDRWAQSSTGRLHDEVEKGRQANAKRITDAKASTTATVLDAALTQFDPKAGKARMIAVVKVNVAPEGQRPAEKRNRYQADMTRTPDGWKLASLGPVAVG